jgi:UDP:flavonoid glycosyltransferase YjiC (YdhE family)
MKRILFVSENVTLAQVVRLVTLARSLDPERYEIHFACSEFDDLIFAGTRFVRHELATLPRKRIDRALRTGRRLYEMRDLEAYLEADLEIIDRVRPALVVGDLRWSLAVAAPLRKLPFAALINAYWSPYALREGFPLPEHPIVELLGVELAARYFPRALPSVFAHFARPLNRLRKRHGLHEIGSLPQLLTHADWVLHPDIPELVPTGSLPSTHGYLGHVPWAPDVPLPPLDDLDPARPLVYVTLGSSGKFDCLPIVLSALQGLPLNVLVSTAGRDLNLPDGPGLRVARYVPGDLASAHASLVISNGGASTAYQALAAGRPVLGIPFNLDQYLAMSAIEQTGAGVLLRSGTLRPEQVREAAIRLLESGAARASARQLAAAMARYDAAARFSSFVGAVTSLARSSPAAGQAASKSPIRRSGVDAGALR